LCLLLTPQTDSPTNFWTLEYLRVFLDRNIFKARLTCFNSHKYHIDMDDIILDHLASSDAQFELIILTHISGYKMDCIYGAN